MQLLHVATVLLKSISCMFLVYWILYLN